MRWSAHSICSQEKNALVAAWTAVSVRAGRHCGLAGKMAPDFQLGYCPRDGSGRRVYVAEIRRDEGGRFPWIEDALVLWRHTQQPSVAKPSGARNGIWIREIAVAGL